MYAELLYYRKSFASTQKGAGPDLKRRLEAAETEKIDKSSPILFIERLDGMVLRWENIFSGRFARSAKWVMTECSLPDFRNAGYRLKNVGGSSGLASADSHMGYGEPLNETLAFNRAIGNHLIICPSASGKPESECGCLSKSDEALNAIGKINL